MSEITLDVQMPSVHQTTCGIRRQMVSAEFAISNPFSLHLHATFEFQSFTKQTQGFNKATVCETNSEGVNKFVFLPEQNSVFSCGVLWRQFCHVSNAFGIEA